MFDNYKIAEPRRSNIWGIKTFKSSSNETNFSLNKSNNKGKDEKNTSNENNNSSFILYNHKNKKMKCKNKSYNKFLMNKLNIINDLIENIPKIPNS